jgi:hypothetical protein
MFDNLRQQSMESTTYEEESGASYASYDADSRFLGLTPLQRFILALMLFLNITVLGFFALLAFERISLPF